MQNKTWTVTQNIRLDEFLRQQLPSIITNKNADISNGKIRRLIIAGVVSVNGKQCRIPAFDLRPSSTVHIQLDEEKFFFEKQPDDINFELTQKDVLFEDDSIIVVNKPAFFPTEETIVKGRGNMHQAVIDYLWKKNPALRNPPYVGIMHRLDRETSGVLLFTKTRSVNGPVHDMFEKHTAKKHYRAVCTKTVSSKSSVNTKFSSLKKGDSFTVDNFIGRVSSKSQACKIGLLPESRGGQHAVTSFKIAEVKGNVYYIDALLHTGRTHQIRVHLSTSGYPIQGDKLYGGNNGYDQLNNRIMLHAWCLEFPHPVTNEIMKVTSPLPEFFGED